MRKVITRAAVVAAVAPLALSLGATSALAHQHRVVGLYETTVGWANEPAYAGFQNAVSFRIERFPDEHVEGDDHAAGEHAEGTPVAKGVDLQVEIYFGPSTDADESVGPLPLEPVFGDPGLYDTALIPTRPGTYTFRILGSVRGKNFEQVYTSGEAGSNDASEGTYNDVQEPDEIEFPVKDPSNGQLDQKVEAVDTDVESAGSKGLIGIVLGGLGVLLGAAALVRAGKRP